MSIEWVAICLVGGSLALSSAATLIIAWRLLRTTQRSERAGEERLVHDQATSWGMDRCS
jgi:hypothetical protein